MEDTKILLKKINNEVVVPMKSKLRKDERPVKGNKLFQECYANIGIIARKKSGKTVTVQKIIKDCAGKSTKILCFSSTVDKDKAMIDLKAWCKKHSITFQPFTSIKDGKIDILDKFVQKLMDEAEERVHNDAEESESDEEVPPPMRGGMATQGRGKATGPSYKKLSLFDDEGEDDDTDYESEESEEEDPSDKLFSRKQIEQAKAEHKINQKLFSRHNNTSLIQKEKEISPEYIIIFDDISHELKSPSLISLLKMNRHFRCKIIISTQYVHDLKPEQLKQMDYLLLFKGLDPEKLEKIRRDADLSLNFGVLDKIYHNATEQPYSFLYVDRLTESYRKCFDKLYQISYLE